MVEVDLFPTQMETDGLFVIAVAPTGVAYNNQCGGTSCEPQRAEGFLIPVGTPQHLATVVSWFRRRFGESCWRDGRLAADPAVVKELAALVGELTGHFWCNSMDTRTTPARSATGCCPVSGRVAKPLWAAQVAATPLPEHRRHLDDARRVEKIPAASTGETDHRPPKAMLTLSPVGVNA
jgi:hypothetical protein